MATKICYKCIVSRPFSTSFGLRMNAFTTSTTTSRSQPIRVSDYLETTLNSNQYSLLQDRSLVRIKGPDATKFLQGLTTNQMSKIERGGDGILTAFLNAQGRVLFDGFLYPENMGQDFPHPSYILDVHSNMKDKVLKHLTMYKIRSKLNIESIDNNELRVYQAWGPASHGLWQHYTPANLSRTQLPPGSVVSNTQPLSIGCVDSRHTRLGIRLVAPTESQFKFPSTFESVSQQSYHISRILLGIPEGPLDFVMGSSLPLESNLDYMNGVDFRKGCYLGQELTIRTYHTGVTRKRLLPVQIYHESSQVSPREFTYDPTATIAETTLPEGADITAVKVDPSFTLTRANAPVGKLGSHIHNVGLALLRLDLADMASASNGQFYLDIGNGFRIQPFIPLWWPVHTNAASSSSSS